MPIQPSSVVRWIWSIGRVPLAYLALTIVLTWPLAAHLSTALGGLGDPQLETWILAWNAHALSTTPASIWQAPIFYPYSDTLAYTDNHLVLSLIAAPVIWVTDNPILAHNLLVVLSFVLTGWGVYHLSYDITQERKSAFIAGVAFAFCTYRISHLVHLQLLQTAWLPWALLFLRRLLDRGHLRDALLLGVFAGVQCVTALYYAFFIGALIAGYILVWAMIAIWRYIQAGHPLPWRAIPKLLVAG